LPEFTTANSQSWLSTARYNGRNRANLALQKGLFYSDDLG
jgi:hypothetical protein